MEWGSRTKTAGSSRGSGSKKPNDSIRRWAYPAALALVYVSWSVYMVTTNSWHLFAENWPVSLTMTLGSFVAGATAEGGAAVAFPVFTKVLQIPPDTAATFGLMIQAIGMTMAGLVILVRRVPILPKVIGWVSLGGVIGQILGTFWLSVGSPYSKILFTFVATVFGVALAISRWMLRWQPLDRVPIWGKRSRSAFVTIGVFGGTFAANTGSGIDMLTFIVLTLALGINEKVSTPTTVIIMGLNSVVGFALHLFVLRDIGVAFDYWLVAVPIVIIGAPLGAYVASLAKRDHIIRLLLSLIALELVTTLILVPFNTTAVVVTSVAIVLCIAWFTLMLKYRERVIRVYSDRQSKRAIR